MFTFSWTALRTPVDESIENKDLMRLCCNTALSARLTSQRSGACLMNGPVRGVRYSGRRNWHPTLMRWTWRSIPQSTMASIAQASPRRRPLTRKRIGICSRCLTDSKAVGPADHFAHRAFGDGFHRAFGLLHVEKEIADMTGLDLP